MSMTDFLENKVLQHVFMNVPYTPPTTVYLALYTVAPSDLGTDGTEVVGGSYARQSVAFALAAGGAGKITNSAALTYTGMPAVAVVAGALFDAVTGGNMLVSGGLALPVTVTVGNNLIANIGQFNFYLG